MNAKNFLILLIVLFSNVGLSRQPIKPIDERHPDFFENPLIGDIKEKLNKSKTKKQKLKSIKETQNTFDKFFDEVVNKFDPNQLGSMDTESLELREGKHNGCTSPAQVEYSIPKDAITDMISHHGNFKDGGANWLVKGPVIVDISSIMHSTPEFIENVAQGNDGTGKEWINLATASNKLQKVLIEQFLSLQDNMTVFKPGELESLEPCIPAFDKTNYVQCLVNAFYSSTGEEKLEAYQTCHEFFN